MARTTNEAVRGILLRDYDTVDEPLLNGFIDSASVVIDRVKVCAVSKGIPLTAPELELTERWLAAHFYAQSDKPYSSRSTGGASASFSGQTAQGFDSTLYGQTAMRIDPSKCLENIDKTRVARGFWLGKPPSEQIPLDQRD